MNIQQHKGSDISSSNEFLGNLIKELSSYIQNNPDNYRGHFILNNSVLSAQQKFSKKVKNV